MCLIKIHNQLIVLTQKLQVKAVILLDIDTVGFIAIFSILVLLILILGKRFCDYCRGRNTYSRENKRNAANELLLGQGESNSTTITLSDARVNTAGNNQGTAIIPL